MLKQKLNNFVIGEENTPLIMEMYKDLATGKIKNYVHALAQEVTDMIFICPNRAVARFIIYTFFIKTD